MNNRKDWTQYTAGQGVAKHLSLKVLTSHTTCQMRLSTIGKLSL